MSNHFLTKKERRELRSNVDLSSLSKSDIDFIYDLYVTKYPAYRHFEASMVAEIISKDLDIEITARQIEIVRDITLQQDILDKQLNAKICQTY